MTKARIKVDFDNRNFDATDGMAIEDKQALIDQSRVFLTLVEFTRAEAEDAIDGSREFEDGIHQYSGRIVVETPRNEKQARTILEMRGWGEQLNGILIQELEWG